MGFLSSRRNRARVAPELDDQELGRLLKSLLATTRTGTIATTDLCAAQVSRLLDQDPGDWDRRTHRISVLADFLAASRLPRSWAAREPRNATALVLHAWSQVAQSRDQDRPGDTDDAVESCLRAAELAPDDPTPWVALLQVARRQRWKQPQVFGVWNEVLARDRWNREAYMNMLSYLTPEEGGSRLQVLEFVDALVARVPANAPCVATELTAQVFQYHAILGRGGYEALVARTHWSQGMAAQALDRVAHTWGQPGFLRHAKARADLNLLAYALMAGDRRAEARAVFEAIGGVVTEWPWHMGGDPLTEFEQAQRRATVGL
ncbi:MULTISPECIES: hypothetical protein [Streptomyces]|uniref:DUF4034 domain-containing protein n=3 Tax=Streptomyces TaxID=1883 RepID=A0ABS9JCW1_9ACTN|nr:MULTISPECIES: hypothetical protein [Streptomyces]MYU27518.1 hypothetical protein [Streptomyces sp. SID7810]CUW26376.1 hypothetical protein TUE45_01088 [Streptomyces reticuli]MCG0063399.1 hypothetical protein [Streptomyces tricolor]OYP19451.1 hypothetical protein CFC35_37390 [Streptomyces sp. FBKL.4005]BCM72275.1 hypothetical protein EASAB2608_07609 [Streptomyces sp. EAS-AB2608]